MKMKMLIQLFQNSAKRPEIQFQVDREMTPADFVRLDIFNKAKRAGNLVKFAVQIANCLGVTELEDTYDIEAIWKYVFRYTGSEVLVSIYWNDLCLFHECPSNLLGRLVDYNELGKVNHVRTSKIKVPSDSDPDVEYEITKYAIFPEHYTCTCPAFKYGIRPCKHIQRLIADKGF